MDFLHTYFLGERPVVVADATPTAAVQAQLWLAALDTQALSDDRALLELAAQALPQAEPSAGSSSSSDGSIGGGLGDGIKLEVPYFLETEDPGSNPTLFLSQSGAAVLPEGTPVRGVACGSTWLMLLTGRGQRTGGGDPVAMDIVLRPPPVSATTCLESALSAGNDADDELDTDGSEGRWTDLSCIHIGKAMWATDTPSQLSCPQDQIGGDGASKTEWELSLVVGELLFVPEGWEYSLLHPIGARGAGSSVVVTVPFGWEAGRRHCC